MGPNLQESGIGFIFQIIPRHKDSFALVGTKSGMNIVRKMARGVRDFDVLQESLGD